MGRAFNTVTDMEFKLIMVLSSDLSVCIPFRYQSQPENETVAPFKLKVKDSSRDVCFVEERRSMRRSARPELHAKPGHSAAYTAAKQSLTLESILS